VVIETGKSEFKPLVTLCEGLLRMFSGGLTGQIVTLIIPEVLIGEILQYTFRTLFLHRPAQTRRFFLPKIRSCAAFPRPSRVTFIEIIVRQMELICFLDPFGCCVGCSSASG
jgi:hypothetical protein